MIKVPKFATEREEADWWYDNREQHAEEFVKAGAEGRLRRGGIVRFVTQLNKAKALVLDGEDARRLAWLAYRKDMDVEVYLKDLIHQAFMQEGDREH